jgi:hypothetical protein
MVVDPRYQDRRKQCLNGLNTDELDSPIADLINALCEFSFCFTIQSCFGHFLYPGQEDANNIEMLPLTGKIQSVNYRIAFIALCFADSHSGGEFLRWLKPLPEIDPQYIQFGCAEWFWERNPNAYVLQVAPERHMLRDKCTVDFREARHIEKVRNAFYDRLRMLVSNINSP